ncbi:MAG: hypothetical protein HC877_00535 [Thioploca sp.]|nr:hypothetical protein [Thioploca sp.]
MNYIARKTILAAVAIPLLSMCALSANADGLTYPFLNTFDTAIVDGYYNDWQPLASNVHIPMYRAGNPTKDVLSDLYLRYDCNSKTIFGLVLKTNSNHSVVGNAWIKIYELGNSPRVQESDNPPNGVQPEFSWVPPSSSVQPNTQGYEASFSLNPGTYTLEAHLNINDNTGSQTSSSGRGDYFVHLNLTCPTESLAINKTANPLYTEEYDWTITKTVDPESHTMFIGDTAQTSTYTVTVDQTVTPTGQKVQGRITITNNTASKTAKIASVIDTITPGDIPVTVDCGVTFPYDLAAEQTLTCLYSQTLASAFNGSNEVIVVPANGSELFGGQDTANFVFDANTPKEATGYPTVDVVDNKEGVLQNDLGEDKTFTYTHDFSCSTDPTDYENGQYQENYDNIATIQKTEDGNTTVIDSDDASVVKTCYKPSVTKNANPSITQTLGWTLDKTVDKTELSMNAGKSSPVNYTVTVGTTVIDTDYAVNGTITVTNPHPTQPITVPVTDMLTGNINATVDCGEGSTELTVAADSSATCNYSANLPNSETRTNTATATFKNIDFNSPAVTVNFAGVVATVVGPTPSPATVTDTNTPSGSPWTTSGSNNWTYEKTLTCSTNSADYGNDGHYSFNHPNTAAITGTNLTDTVTVKVDCYAPTVSKTATPTIDRTLGWTLDKTVTPDHLAMNIGAAGEAVRYKVTVGTEPIADLTKYSVTGDIVVTNTNPTQPMTVTIADNLSGSTNMVLTCDGGTNTPTIPAGGVVNCTYSADLPDDSTRTNTATATLNGLVMSGSATVDFSEVTPTDTGPTPSPATVTDTNEPAGSPWSATGPDEWTYDETLTCSDNSADYTGGHYSFPHPNTAAIEDTDKTADANVTVDCYAPLVDKGATPNFTRTYLWDIDKIANITPNDILLQVGQTYSYTYDITVNVTGHNDTEVTVAGDITVQNPSTEDAMDVSVADNLPGATVTLDCGGALSVAAGSSASCHYEASLADNSTGSNLVNTATVTLNSVQFEAQAPVNFGAPTTEIDECVEVTDQIAANEPWTVGTEVETLGTACVSEGLSKTFTYGPFTVGPYDGSMASNCQLPDNPTAWIDNTATFTSTEDNSNTTGSDSEHVPVCLPQNDSCTLTQGYWKTHSIHGKAPASEGWYVFAPTNVAGVVDNSVIVNLADQPFFKSAPQTYYDVLWTPPKGNAYYNLAHQWIAAYLNWINGASMPADVNNAFIEGWKLLAAYTPAQVKADKKIANQFKLWYPILDSYNNGLVGPGHCSDDSILFGG